KRKKKKTYAKTAPRKAIKKTEVKKANKKANKQETFPFYKEEKASETKKKKSGFFSNFKNKFDHAVEDIRDKAGI
ncbi:MAG: hypothetical protein GY730_05870, partial [bacterium]|nr:hypothetical protein [bacterium]